MEPSTDLLRGLLAAVPDALLAVDGDGRIVFASDQAERLFGWPRAELVGREVECLVPERFAAHHPALRAAYVAHPTTRPMGAGLDLWARRRDGSEFPAEISLSAVGEEDGSLLVLAAVRDVAERIELTAERQRRALDAQREQSHRLESLGQLAGGVAHDFNNLLGVILNYTALLARRVTDPAATADLGEIRAAAERGAALTRQLLTFARRDVVNPRSVDVNDVVRGSAALLTRTLGEDLDLRLELAEGPLFAVVDRQQLEQVVLNLAVNARDAMPGGGRLTIVTAAGQGARPQRDGAPGPDVVLRVVDTGSGMPPDVVKRAFEPFYTTKRRERGSGLGLATVYGIVQQNGGDVTIDSAVGAGTTVTVVLRAGEGPPARGAAPEGGAGARKRILLVEDENALRVATARILTGHGYEVLVASDGVEALEVFDREPDVGLVVTDIAMPRMRGDELARLIADRRTGTPVVMMTGYDSGNAPAGGRVLAKPVSEQDLLRTVREALGG